VKVVQEMVSHQVQKQLQTLLERVRASDVLQEANAVAVMDERAAVASEQERAGLTMLVLTHLLLVLQKVLSVAAVVDSCES